MCATLLHACASGVPQLYEAGEATRAVGGSLCPDLSRVLDLSLHE
jgi:hypothetical protein